MKNIFSEKTLESFDFHKQLRREILLSEKLRAYLLTIVSASAIVVLLILNLFFYNDIEKHFAHVEYVYIIQFIFLIFVIREIIVIRFIAKKISTGGKIAESFRYITSIIEVSIPSFILLSISIFLGTTEVLISPAVFFYFIIIILSTLSLEFKISLTVGLTAAIEYLLLFIILKSQYMQSNNSIIYNSFVFHIGKASIFIISGIITGFVAEQIKMKMIRVNKTLMERNKVINMFGQQISPSIVDYLIENDDKIKSERKYVCVMFLDIREFTNFAESKEPEEIVKYQNDIFGFMIQIIQDHNGVINQFLGDGYMATFGAPVSSENDSQNAVNASLKIIAELHKKNKNGEIPYTRIGIGLHSGYVVAGNVGTELRKQYSLSGNTVILAARIEQLNKIYNSQLLISQEVLENVELGDIKYKSHGSVDIKGREKPIEIFQLN